MVRERVWTNTAKLVWMARNGWTIEDIAAENGRDTGWTPNKGTISRKLRELGEPRRQQSRRDLIPWHVLSEHNGSRFRHMLQAESRKRAGQTPSPTDEKNLSLLYDLTFGRGIQLVVGYHPEIGFYLADKTDADEDIIRAPRTAAIRRIITSVADLDLTVEDKDLAAEAFRLGVRPEELENIDRNSAADRLREIIEAAEKPMG